MCHYLDNVDIFYNVVEHLDCPDILSLLQCLDELKSHPKLLKIHKRLDMRHRWELLDYVVLFPIFTNVHVGDLWQVSRFEQWATIMTHLAPIIRVLTVDSLEANLNMSRFPRLNTLKLMSPYKLDILYSRDCNLEHLYIAYCRVRKLSFDKMQFLEKLKVLYIQDTDLDDLPMVLNRLTALERFYYRNSRLTSQNHCCPHILQSISNCCNLQNLTLTVAYRFLLTGGLKISLPNLLHFDLVLVFEDSELDAKQFAVYWKRLARIFCQESCPRLDTLTLRVFNNNNSSVRYLRDADKIAYSPMLGLAEEFPHLKTLRLLNTNMKIFFENLEIHTEKIRQIDNKITRLYITCPSLLSATELTKFRVPLKHARIRGYLTCGCLKHDKILGLLDTAFPCLEYLYIKSNIPIKIEPFSNFEI